MPDLKGESDVDKLRGMAQSLDDQRKNETGDLNNKLEAGQCELAVMKVRLSEAEASVTTLTTQQSALVGELARLVAVNSALARDKAELEIERASLQAEVARPTAPAPQAGERQVAMEQLQRVAAALMEEKLNSESEVADLRSDREILLREVARLRGEQETLLAAMESRTRDLQSQLRKTEGQFASLQRELDSVRARLEEVQACNDQLMDNMIAMPSCTPSNPLFSMPGATPTNPSASPLPTGMLSNPVLHQIPAMGSTSAQPSASPYRPAATTALDFTAAPEPTQARDMYELPQQLQALMVECRQAAPVPEHPSGGGSATTRAPTAMPGSRRAQAFGTVSASNRAPSGAAAAGRAGGDEPRTQVAVADIAAQTHTAQAGDVTSLHRSAGSTANSAADEAATGRSAEEGKEEDGVRPSGAAAKARKAPVARPVGTYVPRARQDLAADGDAEQPAATTLEDAITDGVHSYYHCFRAYEVRERWDEEPEEGRVLVTRAQVTATLRLIVTSLLTLKNTSVADVSELLSGRSIPECSDWVVYPSFNNDKKVWSVAFILDNHQQLQEFAIALEHIVPHAQALGLLGVGMRITQGRKRFGVFVYGKPPLQQA